MRRVNDLERAPVGPSSSMPSKHARTPMVGNSLRTGTLANSPQQAKHEKRAQGIAFFGSGDNHRRGGTAVVSKGSGAQQNKLISIIAGEHGTQSRDGCTGLPTSSSSFARAREKPERQCKFPRAVQKTVHVVAPTGTSPCGLCRHLFYRTTRRKCPCCRQQKSGTHTPTVANRRLRAATAFIFPCAAQPTLLEH